LDPISGFFSRVSRSVPFSKKKDPRAGRGSYKSAPRWRESANDLVAFPPQLVLRSGGGTGERRIAAHIVIFSVADAIAVSSMTNEGNVWLGVQGSPPKAWVREAGKNGVREGGLSWCSFTGFWLSWTAGASLQWGSGGGLARVRWVSRDSLVGLRYLIRCRGDRSVW
jgi:hypothetical protein